MQALLAAFVGNNGWFGLLLTLHVLGAVVGLGPTFGFAIMGPMAGKVPPPGGLVLIEAMEKIERGMVLPILLTIQLGTGVLLIFNRGLNVDFFSAQRLWLIIGILLFATALVLVFLLDMPAIGTILRLGREGQAGSPEFLRAVKITQTLGPILSVLGVAIVVLMIWKPGSGCQYQC